MYTEPVPHAQNDPDGYQTILNRIEKLNTIGIALSSEKDFQKLQEIILTSAMELTHADGGTLYILNHKKEQLEFEIVHSNSLNISLGGTSGSAITFPPISLYDDKREPNDHMVVSYAVLHDQTVNVPDAYNTDKFDFSGTRKFDQKTGYRSRSFLAVPLKNHENDIIGVLQLLNATEPVGNQVVAFSKPAQQLVESLASQAAVAMTNNRLIHELRTLFESFIHLIASAIDEKSPYQGGHCRRVPKLTMLLADAASQSHNEPFKDFELDEEKRYELEIAAWLHDCGKVATPEYIVDKATKLETIYDRIHTVEIRFEACKRGLEIDFLKQKVELLESQQTEKIAALEQAFKQKLAELDDDFEFIKKFNVGGEFMDRENQQRIDAIGAKTWKDKNGEPQDLLTRDEMYNLKIPKGTLTPEEREVINNHISVTIKMLESLPFPKHLANVPEYAGGHHERMDGKGYPKGLKREQMSVQARIMAIADIFEALTADDRPYKKAKTLSESLFILGKMKEDNHIDPDLFDLFVSEQVYLSYAQEYLSSDQIDAVDTSTIPGFNPE